MNRALLGVLAAGLLAAGAPAASAHDNSQVTSACVIHQSFNFVVGGFSYYLTGAAATPEAGGGTFWCEIRVDGDTVASSVHTHGEHMFASAGPARSWASELDLADLEVCTRIDWDDNHTPLEECAPAADVLTTANNFLNETILKPTDVLTCAVLGLLAPGVPGVVDIDPTGDMAVLGIPFWDCPPYQT